MADDHPSEKPNPTAESSSYEGNDTAQNKSVEPPREEFSNCELQIADSQAKPWFSKWKSWFSEWKELVFVVVFFLISAGLVIWVFSWKQTFAKAVETLSPAYLAMLGAVISTVILYSRWKRDFAQREMIEHNRILNENRRLELQELSKRKEALGSRLATAINHLSSTNGFTQVAGLIELGGLADDWWNLGVAYGAIPDDESQSPDGEGVRKHHDLTFEEVQQRRQEIVTLIFCHKLPGATNEDSIDDEDRQNMVQRARADLLRVHTDRAYLISESSKPSPKSWHHFNLDGAWLKDVQLDSVYLRSTSLVGANLQNARLGGANLQHAKLWRANLQHAKLGSANLQHAKLGSANLQHTQLGSADLQHTQLGRADLQHTQLWRADLQHAKLGSANLQHAKLGSANLQHAQLWSANLQHAQLWRANLQYADLSRAQLQHVSLSRAQLQHADLESSRLQGANLTHARLQGAELAKAKLHHARLEAARLHHANLRRADVRQANLQNADVRQANLQNADARQANLLGANLDNADVQNALYSRETVFPQGFNPGKHGLKLNYSSEDNAQKKPTITSPRELPRGM